MSRSPATIRAEAQTIAKQATEKSLPDNQLIQQLCTSSTTSPPTSPRSNIKSKRKNGRD